MLVPRCKEWKDVGPSSSFVPRLLFPSFPNFPRVTNTSSLPRCLTAFLDIFGVCAVEEEASNL